MAAPVRVTGGGAFGTITGPSAGLQVTGLAGVQAGDLVVITAVFATPAPFQPMPSGITLPTTKFVELGRESAQWDQGSGVSGPAVFAAGVAAGGETHFGIGFTQAQTRQYCITKVDVYRFDAPLLAVGFTVAAQPYVINNGAACPMPDIKPPGAKAAVIYSCMNVAPNYSPSPSAGWTNNPQTNDGGAAGRQTTGSAHRLIALTDGTTTYSGSWSGAGGESGYLVFNAALYAGAPASRAFSSEPGGSVW